MARKPWERGLDKQRLERTVDNKRVFWEVRSTDRTVEERWGDAGGKVKMRTATFPTADRAEAEVARLIAAKQSEGFAPRAVKPAPPPPPPIVATKRLVNVELETTLAQTPDEAEAWQVYGDWLLEHGEAWGEVIAHATRGKSTTLHRAAAEKAWFGESVGCDLDWWRLGVVRTAELRPGTDEGASFVDGVTRMLAHPAGRLVRFLTIELRDQPLQPVVDAIVGAGPLPLLELLTVRTGTGAGPVDLRALWVATPRLRTFTLGAIDACPLGDLAAASRLEALFFDACARAALVTALGAAVLPNLTYLHLSPDDTGLTLAALAGLLAGGGLPKLEMLVLDRLDFDAGLIEALAKSPLVRRLKSLSLAGGVLDSAGARQLVAHAPALVHLPLQLSNNYFTEGDVAAIRDVLPLVGSDRQRAPESPRRPWRPRESAGL